MIVAVADAGPIIHLAEIDAIELLGTVDELYVPETVRGELEAGGVPQGFEKLEFELVVAETDERKFGTGLDEGETAALAVATGRDAVLLTDDLTAREAAKESGVGVHGSIGVVALAFNRGELTEEQAVESMRSLQTETSLFVTDAVVDHGIEMLRDRSSE
ncbi:nucleic acid-binding protein [Halolamina sediminis]|uniref:nucleic acid-binding protein n=1 Tax=Halolamina sediminis TaxID=1480675 RepID=UPI0006B6690A|nr:nucleic acid-binding protein [Halolamina sediminis]